MSDTLVPASDLPDSLVPASDLPDAPAAPAQAAPEQDSGVLGKLRGLDEKYLGGMGRQAVMAGRAAPDAVIGLASLVPDAATSVYNAIQNPPKSWSDVHINPFSSASYPQNAPSAQIGRQLDKVLPHPENKTEAVSHWIESLLSGAKMPVPLGEANPPGTGEGGLLDNLRRGPGAVPPGVNRGDVATALKVLQKRLGQDNTTMQGAGAQVAAANEAGVPLRLSDAGPNTRATAEVLANKPGGAATTIIGDRAGIAADTKSRVPTAVRSALNAQGDAGQFADSLAAARGSRAKLNYEAVRQDSTPVMDPDIWHLLENPQIAKLYQAARNSHDQARQLSTTNGVTSPPLADIYAPAPAPEVTLSGAPPAEPQWIRTGQAPDVRSLDFLQRAMASRVSQLYNEAKSPTSTSNPAAGSIAEGMKTARQTLVDQLKSVSPAFKKASETYGDDSELIEANKIGASGGNDGYLSMSPKQAESYVKGLSDSGRTSLQMGVADKLLSAAESSGRGQNVAQDVLGGPVRQAQLKALFGGDEEKFNLFKQALEQESKLFKNNSAIMGGSQTFRRMEGAQDFQDSSSQNAAKAAVMAAQIAHGGGVGTLVHQTLRFLNGTTWRQGVASQAARILSSPDPIQAAAALQDLENSATTGVPSGKAQAALLLTKAQQAANPDVQRQKLADKYGITAPGPQLVSRPGPGQNPGTPASP